MMPWKSKKPRLSLELMMFAQAVLSDPERNLTRAYISVFESVNYDSARQQASIAWRNPAVIAYVAYLQQCADNQQVPEKTVHVEVEGGGQIVVRPHGKLLEAAEFTQQQLEALVILQLTHGPTDLLDENGEIKPELSHLIDSYKVTMSFDREGNPKKTIEVKMPSKEGMKKMLWTIRGWQPTKTLSESNPFRKLKERQEAKVAANERLAML